MKKLNKEFYNRDSIIVAKELLGKLLIHEIDGIKLSAKIVEVEAYGGVTDKASHSYGGKRTPRVEVMYGDAGHAYVFSIYGKYYCFNTVTNEKENPQAVLIRAVEPIEGIEFMSLKRYNKNFEQLTKAQKKGLTNGPSKLCEALDINKSLNGTNLCDTKIYLTDNDIKDIKVISTTRIGINNSEEAKDYVWRFYIEGNDFVSVK